MFTQTGAHESQTETAALVVMQSSTLSYAAAGVYRKMHFMPVSVLTAVVELKMFCVQSLSLFTSNSRHVCLGEDFCILYLYVSKLRRLFQQLQ